MIIDFHTHTFPDKIADKAVENLAKAANVTAYRAGTRSSLIESMKESGVDISVVLPVATSVKQTGTINDLSKELNGKDGIYYFGGIHPDSENVSEILDGIKEAGLLGIKLHPDYQGAYFDDERIIRILKEAAKRDLLVSVHAGIDSAFPEDVHCTPDMVLRVMDKIGDEISGKLILAHMGACDMPDEALKKLCGLPIFFDTSFVLSRYPEKCVEIIRRHGVEKILFATDSPWGGQRHFVKLFNNLPLTEEEKKKILSENAKKLLKL